MNSFQKSMLELRDYIDRANISFDQGTRPRVIIVFPNVGGHARFDMQSKQDGIGFDPGLYAVDYRPDLPPNVHYRIADIDVMVTSTQEIAEYGFRLDPYNIRTKP